MNVSVITELDRLDATSWPPESPAETNNSSHLRAIEFELALGMEDLRANGFTACIETAAKASNFAPLFNIPAVPGHDWQRLAAVGAVDNGKPVFVFVALNDAGDRIEIQPDMSDAPHFLAFAEAYFQLMLCQSSDSEAIAD